MYYKYTSLLFFWLLHCLAILCSEILCALLSIFGLQHCYIIFWYAICALHGSTQSQVWNFQQQHNFTFAQDCYCTTVPIHSLLCTISSAVSLYIILISVLLADIILCTDRLSYHNYLLYFCIFKKISKMTWFEHKRCFTIIGWVFRIIVVTYGRMRWKQA